MLVTCHIKNNIEPWKSLTKRERLPWRSWENITKKISTKLTFLLQKAFGLLTKTRVKSWILAISWPDRVPVRIPTIKHQKFTGYAWKYRGWRALSCSAPSSFEKSLRVRHIFWTCSWFAGSRYGLFLAASAVVALVLFVMTGLVLAQVDTIGLTRSWNNAMSSKHVL